MIMVVIIIIGLVTKVENNRHLNEPGISSLLEAASHARLDVDSSKSRDLTQHTRNLVMDELMVVVVVISMVGMMLMVMGMLGTVVMMVMGMVVMGKVVMRTVRRMSACNV